jgi:glucokinase
MTVLACDMGGRRIKLGLVRDGAVLATQVMPAEAERPLLDRLGAVAAAFLRLCQANQIALSDCSGIGVSYPSIIDTAKARILDHFGKFGDASAMDLRAWAREALGLPLAIDNDARMALIGEWGHGAGRGCDNLVMMTLGTGIGTAAILEGSVLRGAHGQAGILGGHLTLQQHGRPCVCGNVGCAEAEASTWALESLAKEQPGFGTSALAREARPDYSAIFRLADIGDPCALALKDHSLRVWSAAAVNLIHAYDPELLILGGGIMASRDAILPAIRDHVTRHAHTPWGKVRVAASELGDHAALVACERLVQDQLAKGD